MERERQKDVIYTFFSGMKTEGLKLKLNVLIKKLDIQFGQNWERFPEVLGLEDKHGVANFGYARQSFIEVIEHGDHQLRLYLFFGLLWVSDDIADEIAKDVIDPINFKEHWVPKCVAPAFLNRFRGVHTIDAHDWRNEEDLLSAMFPEKSNEVYMDSKFPVNALMVDLSARYVTCCMTRPEWKTNMPNGSGIENKKFAIDYIPRTTKMLTM